MISASEKYDNTRVSKIPPQFWPSLIVIFIIIFAIPIIIIFIVINTILIENELIIQIIIFPIIISIIWVVYFLSLIKYINICPNAIYFEKNEIILLIKKKKKKVNYEDIIEIIFSFYSYDKDGLPYPRWNVRWKRNFILRTICLTEDNAIRLRKLLDERKINYVWDDHIKEIWEERIKRNK